MTSTTTKAMTPLLLQSRRFRRTIIGFQQTRRQLFFVMTLILMMLLASVAVAWTLNPPPSSWSRTRASPCGRCCPFDASLQALVWNDFEDTSDHLEPQDEVDEDDYEEEEDDHDNPETEPNLHATRRRGRASVVGVSVEQSSGFWAMVQSDSGSLSSSTWWALPVTSSAMDRWAATSGPALTLVQLLGQVDMAGMVFPPHRLAQLLICGLEEQLLEQQEQQVLDPEAPPVSPQARAFVVSIREQIRTILNGASSSQHSTPKEEEEDDDDEYSYTDASNWIRSRVRLPLCTLDQVTLSFVPVSSLSSESITATCRCTLDIVLHPDHSADNDETKPTKKPWTLSLPLTELTVQHVLAAGDTTAYNDYEPLVSYHFLAVALALRYKAPIVVVEEEQAQEPPQPKEEKEPETTVPLPANDDDDDDTLAWAQSCHGYSSLEALQLDFPHYVTAAHLQQSSQRVVQTIEQGFEWHQLQAAWKIARQKQDYKAMAKIQDKMNQLEQQQQEGLSVQPESDMDQME